MDFSHCWGVHSNLLLLESSTVNLLSYTIEKYRQNTSQCSLFLKILHSRSLFLAPRSLSQTIFKTNGRACASAEPFKNRQTVKGTIRRSIGKAVKAVMCTTKLALAQAIKSFKGATSIFIYLICRPCLEQGAVKIQIWRFRILSNQYKLSEQLHLQRDAQTTHSEWGIVWCTRTV